MKLDFTGYTGEDCGDPLVPEHTRDALQRYVEHRILPGGFLTAVLTNDLFGAISRADAVNSAHLKDICLFVYNRMPSGSWGSEETMWNFVEEKFYKSVDKQGD